MKKQKRSSTLLKTFGQIVLISIVLLAVLIGSGIAWLKWNVYQDRKVEQVILKEFYADVKNNPQITVNRFMLWEGDSIADITIQGKGAVNMWYGDDNIPIINKIGDYSTSYACFYVDSKGQKKEYAYDLDLDLSSHSEFRKWFDFEVNTLKDLVLNYDAITAVLKTFPANPELKPFKDRNGERYVRKNIDEDFIIKTTHNNRPVQCDLYTEKYSNTSKNLCNEDSDCLVVPKQESNNQCCISCDPEVINKAESEVRNTWISRNCKNGFSMCTVHDCFNEKIPVAQCIAGTCQLQWKDR